MLLRKVDAFSLIGSSMAMRGGQVVNIAIDFCERFFPPRQMGIVLVSWRVCRWNRTGWRCIRCFCKMQDWSEFFPRILGILEKNVGIIWSFFRKDDEIENDFLDKTASVILDVEGPREMKTGFYFLLTPELQKRILERLFGGWFFVEVFLKVFFLLGWTKTFLLIFAFNLEIGFFASFRKGFSYLPQDLWRTLSVHRFCQGITLLFEKNFQEKCQLC